MNLKEAARIVTIGLSLAATGCESCRDELIGRPGPGQADCDEISHTARPVDGACLENEFDSVKALRATCKGTVFKSMQPCDCGETEVPVWVCDTAPLMPSGSGM